METSGAGRGVGGRARLVGTLGLALCCAPPVGAQNARNLVDGSVLLTYPEAHYSATAPVHLYGTTPVFAVDPLAASGWWYRIDGVDSREWPLPAPTTLDAGLYGELNATWDNLSGSGLRLHERVRVVDREGPSGGFVSEIFASNLGGQPVGFKLFHYLDADVTSTAAGDSYTRVRDSYLAFSEGSDKVRYRAFGNPPTFQVGLYPSIRDLLNDSDADTLSNNWTAPSGDLSAAFGFSASAYVGMVDGLVAGVSVTSGPGLDYVRGDGKLGLYPQVMLEDPQTRARQLWRMRRGTRVAVEQSLPAGPRQLLGTGDFSGGLIDWNVEFDTSTQQFVLGGGALNPQPPAGWKLAATGDLNADGHADILWRNPATQKLAVWTMNGAKRIGVITPSPDQAEDASWDVVGLADFNNGGALDFLWYNPISRKLVIWYMNPQVQRIAGGFTNPAEVGNGSWRALATGDWGKGGGPWGTPDILWQNDTSGKLVLWNMDFSSNRVNGVFLTPDAPPAGYKVVGPR